VKNIFFLRNTKLKANWALFLRGRGILFRDQYIDSWVNFISKKRCKKNVDMYPMLFLNPLLKTLSLYRSQWKLSKFENLGRSFNTNKKKDTCDSAYRWASLSRRAPARQVTWRRRPGRGWMSCWRESPAHPAPHTSLQPKNSCSGYSAILMLTLKTSGGSFFSIRLQKNVRVRSIR
jgi:hypothetical protein